MCIFKSAAEDAAKAREKKTVPRRRRGSVSSLEGSESESSSSSSSASESESSESESEESSQRSKRKRGLCFSL